MKLDPDDFKKWPSYPVASKFHQDFEPDPVVDYDWVSEYAVARYAATLLNFKELDDKALAVITYIGSGTGIFTLGALAAAANAKLPSGTILSLLPSIFCAFAALFFAKRARRTVNAPTVPTVREAVKYAEAYQNGKAAFLPQWNLSMELFRDLFAAKGRDVDRSMTWTMYAVGFLALPVLVTVTIGHFYPDAFRDPPKITVITSSPPERPAP